MLEAIRMIGVIVFILSAPIILAIVTYETNHPDAQRKIEKLCEQHEKLSSFLILVYVILIEVGILWIIARIL